MSSPPYSDIAAAATTKPWSEFLSTTAISLPISLSDATNRLTVNISYFLTNYIHLTLTIFFISLAFHPLSLLILFGVAVGWQFLFFSRLDTESPLTIAGYDVPHKVVAAVMGVVTLVALLYASVWVNLFVSLGVSVFVVLLHAVIRSPADGDGSPYDGFLDAEAGGGYAEF